MTLGEVLPPPPSIPDDNQLQLTEQKGRKQKLHSVGDRISIFMAQSFVGHKRTKGQLLLAQFPGERGLLERTLPLPLGTQK